MALNDLYSQKQIDILRRSVDRDWYMMINHGAVRAGKTKLDNDLFLMELKRVKKNAAKVGVQKPMYRLERYKQISYARSRTLTATSSSLTDTGTLPCLAYTSLRRLRGP